VFLVLLSRFEFPVVVEMSRRSKPCISAGSLGWPFPMLKYKYIFFQIKYAEAILSNSTGKLLNLV